MLGLHYKVSALLLGTVTHHKYSLKTHFVISFVREVAETCVANESLKGDREIKSMP